MRKEVVVAILKAEHLILGDGKTVLEQGAVCVDSEGKIESVGPSDQVVQQNPGEEIRDYGEATILPGLFDMHVHFGYYYSQPDLSEYDGYMIAYYVLKQVVYASDLGITTVGDFTSLYNLCKKMRMTGKTDLIEVPRTFHTHTGVCMTGGHGHEDGITEVDSVWPLCREIRRQLHNGADWTKISIDNRENSPEFTQEKLEAVVGECHRRGVKTAVHAGTQPATQMCIDAGFDTIEHGTFMTLIQAEQMAENNQVWVPTITAYTYFYKYIRRLIEEGGDLFNPISARTVKDQAFFESAANAYRNNLKKFYDTGVTVLAGFDMVLYGTPPLSIHQELAYMIEYDITPVRTIATVTGNPSRVMGLEKITRFLYPELQVDLLAVQGNTAKDTHALDEVLGVYPGGRFVRGG